MKDLNLYVIYIGGWNENAFIELHDIRFVVASKIEDTFDALRKSWWGDQDSLHIDSWGELKYVDGYEISINSHPQTNQKEKLYFLNCGGYDDNEFTELHKNVFAVAESPSEAKAKALKGASNWESQHKAHQFGVENIINVEESLAEGGFSIHLTPSAKKIPFEFTSRYLPLTKEAKSYMHSVS